MAKAKKASKKKAPKSKYPHEVFGTRRSDESVMCLDEDLNMLMYNEPSDAEIEVAVYSYLRTIRVKKSVSRSDDVETDEDVD
jgi:hypothetical protein